MAKKFPTFWMIILVFALVWLVEDLGYLQIQLPWLPVILIIFAIAGIFNKLSG
ncbi:hypothetical protein K9L16_02800 [Candidatus Pacearchaeota archaeon]|nr:hypothetical protein [Candidatus Pacearchaeota archaeon]